MRRLSSRSAMAAERRLQPVGVEGFLRRYPRHHHPRHFRVKPANAVAANDKVGRVEHMPLDKIQYRTIDLRPLWLHQIKNEFRRSIGAFVHNPDCRVVTLGNGLNPNFAFERGTGVVQYRIDRTRRVAIAGQMIGRRTLPNEMLILGNWPPARAAPFNRHANPNCENRMRRNWPQKPAIRKCFRMDFVRGGTGRHKPISSPAPIYRSGELIFRA
jgi:hypothetical protein